MRDVEEIWKDVPGYEGKYKISNKGNLIRLSHYSKRGRYYPESTPHSFKNYKGYIQTYLCDDNGRKTTTIHRLIAKAFIPNPDNKDQINHKNGIKDDNRIENIEWCNQSENMRHAFDTELKEGLPGEKNGRAILSQEEVDFIKTKYNNGETAKEIAKELNLKLSMVRYILKDGGWKLTFVDIKKRDDRANWTKEHSTNSLISKFNKGKKPIIVVGQYTKEGKEIKKFRSINNASVQTGVPRKSIEANVHNRATHAGGFVWRKIEVDINQFKELV